VTGTDQKVDRRPDKKWLDNTKLENVVIAYALQLKTVRRDATPVLFRFNYDANAKFEVAQLIQSDGLIRGEEDFLIEQGPLSGSSSCLAAL